MAFHPGDRVELVATDDPYTRLRPGDRGTVTGVREVPEPTIDVQWDDGSTLSVLPGTASSPESSTTCSRPAPRSSDADPGAERQRVRRALDADGPAGVSGLDADLGPTSS
jgi:hypothetical protein